MEEELDITKTANCEISRDSVPGRQPAQRQRIVSCPCRSQPQAEHPPRQDSQFNRVDTRTRGAASPIDQSRRKTRPWR